MKAGDITLYAVWVGEIIFNANGGLGTMENQIIKTDAMAKLTTNSFTRTGYTFAGWTTTADGDVNFFDGADYKMKAGDITLYAVWIGEIIFNANGGLGTMENQIISDGKTVSLTANIFTKKGFLFAGWATTTDGDVDFFDGADYKMIAGDMTLYAVWVGEIIFNANGGLGTMENQRIKINATVPLNRNTFTRTGYTFLGWATTETSEKVCTNKANYTMAAGGATLYAVWQEKPYMIIYDVNGGNTLENYQDTVVFNLVSTLRISTRTGYDFMGWYSAISAGNQITDENGVMLQPWNIAIDGTILYARWQIANYDLTVNKNLSAAGTVTNGGSKEFNSSINLTAVTNNGYTWSGWYSGATLISSNQTYTFKMPANNYILTARWTANTYTIQLDANGGNVWQSSKDVTFASSYTLPIPSRTGKTFQGWFTSISSGTKMTSSSGSSIENWSSLAEITLYAQWTNTPYTITFDTDGGSYVSSKTCHYGDYVSLPTITRYKYDTFNGWTYNSTTYTTSFTMPANNVSMKAKFTTEYTYIKTKQDMENIINNLSGKYMLISDIDLGEWTPIGTYEFNNGSSPTKPFTGIFDGDNHTMTYKISIKGTQQNNNYGWGLFGSVFNAKILNLKVSVSIYGDSNSGNATSPTAGGVAGWAKASSFTNCTSSGRVTQDHNGSANKGCVRSGGIVGIAYSSTFTNCKNEASIMAGGFYASAAGIAGGVKGCSFTNCSNIGSVNANHGAWWFGRHVSGGIYTNI